MAKDNTLLYGAVLVIGAILLFNGGYLDGILGSGDSDGDGDTTMPMTCPSDGDTTLKTDVRNTVNISASEEFDIAGYVYDSAGALITTISDTTDTAGVTVNCGDTYSLKFVSSTGANGDNAQIEGIDYGPCTATSDGFVSVKADRSVISCGLQATKHGVLTFKMYDEDEAAFIYDNSTATNTVFMAEGETFQSTTNTVAKVVGTGSQLHGTLQIKGAGTDKDSQDYYTLILIEAPLTDWEEPAMMLFDGVALSEMSDQMTEFEKDQFATYEYAYKVTTPFEDTIHKLEFQIDAKAGVNPDDDVEIDFAIAGNYLSTDGVSVLTGAAKDDSTNTVVFAVQDVTWDIS